MYVGIDPEVAAKHRELVNRHWAEMERLRNSARRNTTTARAERISTRQHIGSAIVALGVWLAGKPRPTRTVANIAGWSLE